MLFHLFFFKFLCESSSIYTFQSIITQLAIAVIEKEMEEYCVTGGTGFIAAYLVKTLLDKGHIVRTTVRDPGS